MKLLYRDKATADAVRDALRAAIAPVFSCAHQPNAEGWYEIECNGELLKAVQLTAMAFPRLKTREMLFTLLRAFLKMQDGL